MGKTATLEEECLSMPWHKPGTPRHNDSGAAKCLPSQFGQGRLFGSSCTLGSTAEMRTLRRIRGFLGQVWLYCTPIPANCETVASMGSSWWRSTMFILLGREPEIWWRVTLCEVRRQYGLSSSHRLALLMVQFQTSWVGDVAYCSKVGYNNRQFG